MSSTGPGTPLASAHQRIADVDALRGFALFGILLVNITAFASVFYGTGVADPLFGTPIDRAIELFIAFAFETKFYLLFSFLFGYSFTLQMQSAERAGEAFLPRMLRRQLGLWLIGLLHAVLLFHGDILTTYAVLGVILLLLRHMTEARALTTAKWLIVAAALVWGITGLGLFLSGNTMLDTAVVTAEAQQALQAYRGSPRAVIGQHVQELSSMWVILAFLQGPCALAMFLVGLSAGKRQVFLRFEAYARLFRRILIIGLAVGVPGAAFYAYASTCLTGTAWDLIGLAVGLLTAPLLTGAYVAAATFGFQSTLGKRVSAMLAPAGRMALSNYLLQSFVCAVIFTGYGFGLVGEVPPVATLGIAAGIFVAQLVLSRWWLGRFAYGPLEWLLRAATVAAWPRWRGGAITPPPMERS